MRAVGADPELLGQALAFEQPEDGLGVADVDGEQHAREPNALGQVVVGAERLADPLGERLGGQRGSSPSPRSSSTVTSPEVKIRVRGMIRLGRFLSQTQTSSISTSKSG